MKIIFSLLLLIGSAGALELGSIGIGQAVAQMILALVMLDKYTGGSFRERK